MIRGTWAGNYAVARVTCPLCGARVFINEGWRPTGKRRDGVDPEGLNYPGYYVVCSRISTHRWEGGDRPEDAIAMFIADLRMLPPDPAAWPKFTMTTTPD